MQQLAIGFANANQTPKLRVLISFSASSKTKVEKESEKRVRVSVSKALDQMIVHEKVSNETVATNFRPKKQLSSVANGFECQIVASARNISNKNK